MENSYGDNKVTLTLGEFLALRDAKKILDEMKSFALNSKETYGTQNRRDVHEIGYHLLAKLDIPVNRDEDKEADTHE